MQSHHRLVLWMLTTLQFPVKRFCIVIVDNNNFSIIIKYTSTTKDDIFLNIKAEI